MDVVYHALSTSAPNTCYISSSNSSYQGAGFLFGTFRDDPPVSFNVFGSPGHRWLQGS